MSSFLDQGYQNTKQLITKDMKCPIRMFVKLSSLTIFYFRWQTRNQTSTCSNYPRLTQQSLTIWRLWRNFISTWINTTGISWPRWTRAPPPGSWAWATSWSPSPSPSIHNIKTSVETLLSKQTRNVIVNADFAWKYYYIFDNIFPLK